MLRRIVSTGIFRPAQLATECQKVHTCSRSIYTSSKALDTPVSADHGKVSTADEGDIGRGTHDAAPVEAGDSSDVVPNLVTPDDTSGKVPKGLQEAKGFKSQSSGSPQLATQTTAEPGQAAAEVATAPTPGLPPSDKIPPVKP